MNLGRTLLLAEGVPLRNSREPSPPSGLSNTGIARSSGRWGSESEKTRSGFSIPLSKSTQQAMSKNSRSSGDSKSDSHASFSSEGETRDMKAPKAKSGSRVRGYGSSSGPTLDAVASDKQSKQQKALNQKFPSEHHSKVHFSSPEDAHKELDKIWSKRHAVNPDDKDYTTKQSGELVKTRGGGLRKEPKLKFSSKKETGNKNMLPHSMPGIHHSDKSVRERAWKMQAQAQANSLGDSYSRRDPSGKRRTPRAKVRVVQHSDGSRYTQTSFAHKPSEPLPRGHSIVHSTLSEGLTRRALLCETRRRETRRLPKKPKRLVTQVLPRQPEEPLASSSAPTKRMRTARLPRQSPAKPNTPLEELVTAGNVFATGLKPGDPITSSTPRDQRNLAPTPRPGGAVTTRDVGHTANTGAWVPDKKKRDVKIPDLSKLPKTWDAITTQLASMQPSNTGGVLTMIARSRPTKG